MLFYRGLSWPSLVFERRGKSVRFVTGDSATDHEIMSSVLIMVRGGRGRPWQATRESAVWRDLAEIDIGDPEATVNFVRRRGDPIDRLSPTSSVDTADWYLITTWLRLIAQGWDPEDGAGISRPSASREKSAAELKLVHSLPVPIMGEFSAALDMVSRKSGSAIPLRASTFRAFLLGSAISALLRRVPMRRCVQCRSWFEMLRADARFCSPACKSAHHKERQHGVSAPAA